MSNQPAPSQTDREPREIFLAAVHDRFDDGKMSWENAWNTCAKVTHTSVYDSWMAKLKNQPEDLKKKAADIANTLPSAGELDARNDRLRRVVELVNEVMVEHPRLPYDDAFARVQRDNPELFASMQQAARPGR